MRTRHSRSDEKLLASCGRFLSEFKNTEGILSSSISPWESRDTRVDETDMNFSQRDVRSRHVNAIVARCSRNAVYSCILVFLVTHHPCNTRACTRRAGGLDVFVMFLLEVPVFSFSLLKIPARSSARSPYGYAKGHAMLCGGQGWRCVSMGTKAGTQPQPQCERPHRTQVPSTS